MRRLKAAGAGSDTGSVGAIKRGLSSLRVAVAREYFFAALHPDVEALVTEVGWNSGSAAYTSSWWNPWANGWNSKAVQPDVAVTGALALAMFLGRALVGPLFAQSAWNHVTFAGGEVREPGRNLPRALLIGCVSVVALYLLANLAYVVTLPLAEIQQAEQSRVATAAMRAILGAPGTVLM